MKTLFTLSLLLSTIAFAEGNGGERGGENELVLAGTEIRCIDTRENKHSYLCTEAFCDPAEVCRLHIMSVDQTPATLSE